MGSSALREVVVYPRLLTRVLPLVQRELRGWVEAARAIPDAELRKQALASISRKKFHCVGGAVLALMDPPRMPGLVRAIVAIQTISDYLDNLCDRASVVPGRDGCVSSVGGVANSSTANGIIGLLPSSERTHDPNEFLEGLPEQDRTAYSAFMRLHESMLCAVDPDRTTVDYYSEYLPAGDGGYLDSLVDASRATLRALPAYGSAKSLVLDLVTLYSELQAGKHLSLAVRDGVMKKWFRSRYMVQPNWLNRGLHWWEFGAATGSTLAMFALICASGNPEFDRDAAASLTKTYFPSICGLHILLDYYIDQAEDVAGGDLNFVAHYSSRDEAVDALEGFVRWSAWEAARASIDPGLHLAVVRGLLAMYLSDPKVRAQGMEEQALRLSRVAGGPTNQLRASCALLRKMLRF